MSLPKGELKRTRYGCLFLTFSFGYHKRIVALLYCFGRFCGIYHSS